MQRERHREAGCSFDRHPTYHPAPRRRHVGERGRLCAYREAFPALTAPPSGWAGRSGRLVRRPLRRRSPLTAT
jgi:hypothetical protein